MVYIDPGWTGSDTDLAVNSTLTQSNLFNLVASATVTSIAVSEFEQGDSLIMLSSESAQPATDQGSGAIYGDSGTDIIYQKGSSRWDGGHDWLEVKNASGADPIPKGALCRCVGTDAGFPTVSPTTAEGSADFVGFASATLAADAVGYLRKHGWVEVIVEAPQTRGDALISGSTVTGALTSGTDLQATYNYTHGLTVGSLFKTIGGTGSTLVTCLVYV